jgi:hypothetical protein
MRNAVLVLMLMFALAVAAIGQTFSSGSTGVDGPLDLTSGDRVVQLPDSGILNYTTVNIPAGRTLTFQNNLANAPVIMLAQGAVNIVGLIDISAHGGAPGPGGFYGGGAAQPGFGPGGGQPPSSGSGGGGAGQWIGPLSLVPNVGGSGGGGSGNLWCSYYYASYVGGGGGGGAITIASSASIALQGAGGIYANGSNQAVGCGQMTAYGSSGALGAIRLVANTVSVSGTLTAAVVRLEGPTGQVTYTGCCTPPVVSTINPLIAPTKPPSIIFTSIGGYAVPSSSGSSFSTIDVLLPTQLQDPIPVIIQATNVPVGSPITISFSGPGGPTSTTATLSGSTASSNATLYVSGLVRSGLTYLFALATFDPTLIATGLKQVGPNAVARVELAVAPGRDSTFRFLRRDGTEVSLSNVPVELRRALGL